MRWGRVTVRTPTIACEERAFAVPPRCLACRWVSRHFRHHDRIVLDSGEKLAYPSKPVRFAQIADVPGCRRAGRCISSWTLRPGMIYDPAAQARAFFWRGKYQGDRRRRAADPLG